MPLVRGFGTGRGQFCQLVNMNKIWIKYKNLLLSLTVEWGKVIEYIGTFYCMMFMSPSSKIIKFMSPGAQALAWGQNDQIVKMYFILENLPLYIHSRGKINWMHHLMFMDLSTKTVKTHGSGQGFRPMGKANICTL